MSRSSATRQDIYMTCHAPVDWRFDEQARVWKAFEAGTKVPHKCPTGD